MSRVEPPIKLKTTLPATVSTVTIARYVADAGGNNVKRMATLPRIADEMEPELALRVYDEYKAAMAAPRLSLTNGSLRFEFFPQLLSGQARRHWDAAAAPFAAALTNANFDTAIEEWLSNYLEPTAYSDQKEYFVTATKAFSMSVKETASRIKQIVAYMVMMPGYPGGGAAVYTDAELKTVFYRIMRPQWKVKFDASGNDITDVNYTWDNLVRWMSAQERAERARDAMVSRSAAPRAAGRGRGRSYGRGRGGYGRGFGRGTGRFSSYGRGYTGRSSSPYGYQGRGYAGRSSPSGRGQTRPYDGDNYGPPAQRQRTNDGSYINGGGHRPGFNAARGRGGYAFRPRVPARGHGGAYHQDHYHVQEDNDEAVAAAPSNDSDDFQEPASQHQESYVEPGFEDHYGAYDEEMELEEPYYGDY